MEILLSICVALIVGGGIVAIAMRAIIQREKQQNQLLTTRCEQLQAEKENLSRQEATTAAELRYMKQELLEEKEQYQKMLAERQALFQAELLAARESMRTQFEEETRQRTEQLKQANAEHMEQVVAPLKRELDLLRELMAKSKESSDKNTASLEQSIKSIIEHDIQRDKTTQTLADALKNRGKVQGDWGEQILTNILQDSGLRKGEEYFVQDNVKDEEGNNLRPDVIVKGADGTRIIIDSKVSLTAYSDYVGAEDEAQRKAAIKANYDSIWKHVEELASKKYNQLVEQAVPIVLMFVPNEGSYILAMNHDSNLGSKAYQKGVLIINPTNLMVVLRLILITWQNTRQDKNYEAIRKAAIGIYEKYCVFAENYLLLGRQIDTVRSTFEKGVSQLKEGKGNLSNRLESLLQYGVTPNKSLPEGIKSFLNEDE